MKALVWTPNDKLEYQEVDEPQIRKANDVKVKIFGTGICGTDLNVLKGKMNATHHMIMGHESVGAVVEVGPDVTNVKVGDRVVIDPTQFCGKCHYCRRGLTCYCETSRNGSLESGRMGRLRNITWGKIGSCTKFRIPWNGSEPRWLNLSPVC